MLNPKGYTLQDKIKICDFDSNVRRFTIRTNLEMCEHYNTVNANYWQLAINDETGKEKWFLRFVR